MPESVASQSTPAVSQDEETRIKIIGVGGAGSNAVDRLKLDDLGMLDLAVVNTDSQALNASPVSEKLLIGRGITNGLSAGDPEIGREAALASADAMARMTDGFDLVFLLAGLGRGTGSGCAPVLADVASQRSGALVIAFATLPFSWEGERRLKIADDALVELRKNADAVICLPNDQLLQQASDEMQVLEAFGLADGWISSGVAAICAMLRKTGLINQDITALRRAFTDRGGKTLFAIGSGEGENRVAQAIEAVRMCPLVHQPHVARRADNLIVNIIGGTDLKMQQVHEIIRRLNDEFGGKKSLTLGAVIDEGRQDTLEICVIGTTDISRRGYALPTRPMPAQRPREEVQQPCAASPLAREAKPATAAPRGNTGHPLPVHESKLPGDQRSPDDPQEEFSFFQEEAQRGIFDQTERNLYDGEDLDVPTFLRRNIKIVY
ncbi:MAG: cell division protein FtsZ [Verrucomicrobiota bacterium]